MLPLVGLGLGVGPCFGWLGLGVVSGRAVGTRRPDASASKKIEFLSCSAHARMRHSASWSLTRFCSFFPRDTYMHAWRDAVQHSDS